MTNSGHYTKYDVKMSAEERVFECQRLRRVLEQLQELGWSKIESLDEHFSQLTLVYRDENTEKVGRWR